MIKFAFAFAFKRICFMKFTFDECNFSWLRHIPNCQTSLYLTPIQRVATVTVVQKLNCDALCSAASCSTVELQSVWPASYGLAQWPMVEI